MCSITQVGSTRSINAGVASGIAMHTWLRQHALGEVTLAGRTTRSSRWTTSWGTPSGRSAVRWPATVAQPDGAERGTRPLANTLPSRPAISTASSASKRALHLAHAGGEQRHAALEQRLAGAVVDHDRARSTRPRTRSRACGRAGAGPWGAPPCPRPGAPATTASSTPSREACAITARTPDHAAILAAASFDAMPAAPPRRARAAGQRLERVVDLDDLLDQRRRRVEAGVGREQAGRVGEEHEQVGGHEVGDEGGEAVVVAEADLVVGDGVVLVDHGHDAELEQALERGAGVEVLLADREVERGEEHLAGHEAVRRRARSRTRASAGSGPRPTRPAA